MERSEWRPFLERWSAEWIAAHDPEKDGPLDPEVVRDGWLGFGPAAEKDVAAAEERLGRRLPPSLREFLLVTDGWRDAGCFVYRLAGAAELAWLRETGDASWIDAYGGWSSNGVDDNGDLLRRSLRLSLRGDVCVMFLDPEDVDEHGEWAGYWLSSWSGEGPRRHGSFRELMNDQYASFHALRQPPGETRDRWDARVESARRAALGGAVEGPAAEFAEAARFGRHRAKLLRGQLLGMRGDWYGARLGDVVLFADDQDALTRDPLFGAELLPLLFAEDRLGHTRERFTIQQLVSRGGEAVKARIADFEARRREPGFRLPLGNAEFDAVARGIADRLAAEPDPGARRALGDALWPELRAAMALWRPVSENHVAPVVLMAEPVLGELITPERGRELLAQPRG